MIYPIGNKLYDFSEILFMKRVGIKMSGGADSAIVAYMLWKTIQENDIDCEIVVLTTNHQGKSFQEHYAKKTVEYLNNKFNKVKVHTHLVNQNPAYYQEDYTTSIGYIEYQEMLVAWAHENLNIEAVYTGITANPPKEIHKKFRPNSIRPVGPVDDRENSTQDVTWNPLIYTDKKGVAHIYDFFDIRDLFKITWSCEEYAWPTGRRESHCGKCWFCKEREWGFGEL